MDYINNSFKIFAQKKWKCDLCGGVIHKTRYFARVKEIGKELIRKDGKSYHNKDYKRYHFTCALKLNDLKKEDIKVLYNHYY